MKPTLITHSILESRNQQLVNTRQYFLSIFIFLHILNAAKLFEILSNDRKIVVNLRDFIGYWLRHQKTDWSIEVITIYPL